MEKTRQEDENKLQGAAEFGTMVYADGNRRCSPDG